jgi:crotonobetainyl-CoA:carnitine CoA-transferase CaiB-like acyl-CoA transferase
VLPVRTLREIRRSAVTPGPRARCLERGPSVQVRRQPHPAGGLVDTLAPAYARLWRHPLRYLDPAPEPGSHTLEILREPGASESERQSLVDRRVAAIEPCEEYLPP